MAERHLEQASWLRAGVAHAVVEPRGTQTVSPGWRIHVAVVDRDVDGHVEHLPHLTAVVVPLEREPVAGLRR